MSDSLPDGRDDSPTISAAAEVAARVAAAIAQEVDLGRIVSVVLEQTTELLAAGLAHVHLAIAEREELRLVGHRNLPPELAERLARVPFDAPWLAARAARTQEIQVIEDSTTVGPELVVSREVLSRTDSRSMVSAPLLARGRVVGVLTYGFPEPRQFSAEKLATIRTIATIFAVGLTSALTYDSERKLRAQLENVSRAALVFSGVFELQRVLQSIADQARVVADAEYAALGIVAAPDRPFEPWVFSGVSAEQAARIGRHARPVGNLGAVVETGRPVRLPDLHKSPAFIGFPKHHPEMTSLLGVPVRFEGRSLGNLYLTNKRGGEEFTKQDEHIIELFAAHAGAALEHAQLREVIASERTLLQTILEHAPHGVIFVEADIGQILANPAATELTGQALTGAMLADYEGKVCRPDGSLIPLSEWPVSRALRGETVSAVELSLERPSGERSPVLASAVPIKRPDGSIRGAVVLFEDISTLKELERLREEFAAIVVHDLRNPISMLNMETAVLLQESGQETLSVTRSSIERMRRATQRLTRMVNDLTDATRIEIKQLPVERARIALPALASALLEQIAPTLGNHSVDLEVEGDVPAVLADHQRIEQILTNLLVNAAKYSAEGTPIRLTIRRAANGVTMSVQDRGMGISPADLPRLFDRFYRTKRARQMKTGLGLGLFITKGLVEAHGGRIWVESTLGQGSNFYVWLPQAPPRSEAPAPASA